MAKRNKPGEPKKKAPGTQYRRRDWERGLYTWSLLVPQASAGTDPTFSMEDAIPDGEDPEQPDNPAWRTLFRWRIDRDGQSFHVYGSTLGFSNLWNPGTYSGPLELGATFVRFKAQRRCEKGRSCPLVRYYVTDIDYTLSNHRPGWCPAGVTGPGLWRRDEQVKIVGSS